MDSQWIWLLLEAIVVEFCFQAIVLYIHLFDSRVKYFREKNNNLAFVDDTLLFADPLFIKQIWEGSWVCNYALPQGQGMAHMAVFRKQGTSRHHSYSWINKIANPGKIKYQNTKVKRLWSKTT